MTIVTGLDQHRAQIKQVVLPYCEIYSFNSDGKVAAGRAYFDQLTLLTQLGHAQAPA
jgi:hypothetical protein